MKVKVALLSAGLGNISRGFEISASNWFEAIASSDELLVKLYAGGRHKNAIKLWNWQRQGRVASFLRLIHLIHDGCRLEQITFGLSFLFHIISFQPDIIWLQEGTLGNLLLAYRKIFSFRYKLIFCDGAPVGHNFAKKFDYIVFLHQYAFNNAISDGIDGNRCSVIPHLALLPENQISKKIARAQMKIPGEKFVIICVAAWNKHHKRIDYLLKEVANLNGQDITLLLCGQPESDTLSLKEFAKEKLIDVKWETFSQHDLSIAYSAADIFVLPSLHEGLGAVMIEAAAHTLPVICHPYAAGKFIFGENYLGLTDLSIPGNLTKKILEFKNLPDLHQQGSKVAETVHKKFNRDILTGAFINFIKHASGNQHF